MTSTLLNGCSSDEPTGTHDTVVVTPSTTGTVSVVNGGSKAVTLSFNSSDTNAVSDLTVTSGLTLLPAGWGGPSAFDCTTVKSGSGCVLTLTYAPTAGASGTLIIGYMYTNSAGVVESGAITIPYAATMHNSVSATASPSGQINAVVGASQAVTLTFTTDDGNPATALTVTDLTALPAGWRSAADSFGCARVSTGSGCLLPLSFAPNVAGDGTLTLNYSYTDNAGAAKTGTVSVAFAATAHDNIVGSVAPSGQVNAVIGGASQNVDVTFTTDDHSVATSLVLTSDFAALPSGWSTTGTSFACASVATGNGCQLQLTYAPSAAATGTLTLNYSYRDDAGTPKTGSLNIAYAATVHNNVVATASPSGQVNAVVGSGAQTVSVNFTTDSGVASAFTLTLSSLPSGWTSTATSVSCATVRTSGSACQLPLSYAPSAVGSGTLILNYSYTNNAGNPATGTVSIPYASTAHDTVSGAVSPSGTVGVAVGGDQAVTVIFTTNDGNTASGLAIASGGGGGLGSLPSGWSVAGGATTFACGSVGSGAGCELNLTYAPTAVATGTATLDFSYLDNAGTAQMGTVSIAYAASAAQHAYVSDFEHGLYMCSIDAMAGTLSNCQTTGGFSGAWSVAFFSGSSANYAYVVDGQRNSIHLCTVNDDGTLSTSCTVQGTNYSYPEHLIVSGSTLYAADQGSPGGGEVTMCTIDSTDGSLSGCAVTASGSGLNYASGIALGNDFAFVPTDNNGLFTCAFDSTTGLMTNCAVAASSSSVGEAWNVVLSNGVAYFANAQSGLTACAVDGAGDLSSCSNTSPAGGGYALATGVDIDGGWAYVSTWNEDFGNSDVYLCAISGLTVSACTVAVSDGSDSGFFALTDVIIH
jgi:hypothetical protein